MEFQRVIFPLPIIPSHEGRGIFTFYEIIKVGKEKNRRLFIDEIRFLPPTGRQRHNGLIGLGVLA